MQAALPGIATATTAVGKEKLATTADDGDRDLEKSGGVVSSTAPPPVDEQPARNTEIQAGVHRVEAIASTWSRPALHLFLALLWLSSFILALESTASSALLPYVTSAFALHSLTPTVGIIAAVAGGCCNLTVAKVLDVLGRAQGYALGLLLSALGLVMMAATQSVELYAAAQVFWTVGYSVLGYTMTVLIADTTGLRNRILVLAVCQGTPSIITTWLGGPISEGFLGGPGWPWAYGMLSILMPVLCSPVLVVLVYYEIKSRKLGNTNTNTPAPTKPIQTAWQHFLFYATEFDAIGIILITSGLALFLLPFNLYTLQPQGWQSPLIICLLVFGFALMVLFALWERFLAPVTFIPYHTLTDRNVVGGGVLGATLFFSYYVWSSYFSSYLQVVNGMSVTSASYVVQINSLLGPVASVLAGLYIRHTGRFKKLTLFLGIPLYVLFSGLLIHFRRPENNVGLLVMCQVFIALASGIVTTTPTIAAMSTVAHQHIATVVAVLGLFSSVGQAISLTVAGVVWQNTFPASLASYLPEDAQPALLDIYGSLDVQLSYPWDSPERLAIQRAYGDAQSLMLATATAIWVVGAIAVAFWKDIDVREIEQVRGQVL